MARYAIGRLYRPPKIDNGENLSANAGEDESKETIGGLAPINFIAVATPHLGSQGNKQVISFFPVFLILSYRSIRVRKFTITYIFHFLAVYDFALTLKFYSGLYNVFL